MLRLFARSLNVPQRVTQLAVRTLTTSRATPLVSNLLKRSLPLPRLRPSSSWSNGLKGSNRMFSTKGRSKDKLMELEAQANARPGDASAQHALLKELSEKFPQLVVARFESGKFAANPACVLEYLKATEKLGVAGKFDSDVFESAYGSGREYMSSQSQFQPSTSSSYSSSSYQYRPAPSEYQMPSPMQSHAANMLLGSNPNQPIYIKPIPESWTSVFGKTLVYVAVGGVLFFVFVQWLTQQASSAMQQQAGAQVKPLHKELGANAKPGEKPEVAVTFQDVKGCDEAKAELQEIVAFLKNPEQFTRLGGKLPKGVLLLGPPGTGKTLLAKAVAGEAGVPFFYCSGSEFEEMYVGVGARRVRDLFAAAKRKSPCIIFIDEIDAVGGRRQFRDHQSAGRMTLNQLLTELDGFQSSSGVIVIGATNFPRLLDKALTRPGRFDKHVVVSLPDIRGRTQILELYAAKIPLDKAVDLSKIARGTPGCSGADLSNLINMAALKASTNKKTHITQKDLEDARDTVLMGAERKSMVQTDEDKRNTAYHEGGHTIMAIKTKGAYPIHKATILPRGQALGVTHMLPERDQYSMSRQQLVAKLDVAMGGYVAEELVFGPDNVTSGASNDLESATHIAREMVTRYGMGEKLGRVAPENTSHLSQETQKMIDEDVKSLVDGAYARAKSVLTQNMGELHSLAKALQKYETLDSTEIKQVISGQALQRDDAKAH